MSRTLVIAEAGCTWRYGSDHLAIAERSIREAKAAGADCWKTQWTSNGPAMAKRRGLDDAAGSMYSKYLMFPQDWLPKLKAMCDEAGIEFMCTVYLPQDIPAVALLVNRLKVSAFEGRSVEFIDAHIPYVNAGKELIISVNSFSAIFKRDESMKSLLCVSKYPTPIEELGLARLRHAPGGCDGLSDHTTSTLTGALCVAAGGTIVEKHVRLWDTPPDNPDHGHSLILDSDGEEMSFAEYVRNVREAERCM